MKTKWTLFLVTCCLCLHSGLKAQTAGVESNYVVIGAFSIPKNATEFVEAAKALHMEATSAINLNRNLFYVYVLQTNDLKVAFDEAKKLRKNPAYDDAWVYSGILGEIKGMDLNPTTGNKIATIQTGEEKTKAKESEKTSEKMDTVKSLPVKQEAVNVTEDAEGGARSFLFKIYTGDRELSGDVDVKDLDKPKSPKVASYRGNEAVNVKSVNKSGNMEFECEVFGYRKMKYVISFKDPKATEGITFDDSKFIVPFDLVRLKKGDFAVMYNVIFFKDAAVMRPESKYEVNSLLAMMKENPKYKIRIHGHTNGNSGGKIISMNPDSKSFFSLDHPREGRGSAKKLSEERANVIQKYLIFAGVDPSRMEIKAWGGERGLYEEDHPQAHNNVRVEIEIIED